MLSEAESQFEPDPTFVERLSIELQAAVSNPIDLVKGQARRGPGRRWGLMAGAVAAVLALVIGLPSVFSGGDA